MEKISTAELLRRVEALEVKVLALMMKCNNLQSQMWTMQMPGRSNAPQQNGDFGPR